MSTNLPKRLHLPAIFVSTVAGVLLLQALQVGHHDFDVRVYRGAVEHWAHGGNLYDFGLGSRHLGFTYPPFAALCLLPMATLPMNVVIAVNKVVILVAITAILRIVVARLPVLHRADPWLLACALTLPTLLLQPVRDTLDFGQVNIALAGLVTLDLVLIGRGNRWAGVGAGLATAIKLTPGLFVVLYLVSGARRAGRTAVLTFLGATVLAALVAPGTSRTFWTATLFDSTRIGSYDSASNQSLAGALTRLGNTHMLPLVWLPLVLIITVTALAYARLQLRAGAVLPAFTTVGLAACLASPISWVHHLWWIVPALLLLLDRGIKTQSRPLLALVGGLTTLFASGLPDRYRAASGHHLDSLATILAENAYVVAVLLLLVLVGRLPVPHLPSEASRTALAATPRH